MPKRGIAALLITTGALVLLLNFKTPDQTLPAPGSGVAIVQPTTLAPSVGAGATPSPATGTSTPKPSTGAASPKPTATTAATAATVDGPVVSTQYGDVQVEVVVARGKVQDVVALQLPTGRRSGQISSYSAPILRQEALSAQSASINSVSGATYTSDAYAQSLQAALQQAGLG